MAYTYTDTRAKHIDLQIKPDYASNRRVQHLTASKDKEQLFISQYQMYLPIVEDLNIE